jgi:adenylate cyclase
MNRLTHDTSTELRTGISAGQVIIRDDDFFGSTVNNAAALTKLARPRQIVIDERSLNKCLLPTSSYDRIDDVTIKGQKSKCSIFRINWENDMGLSVGATAISHSLNNKKISKNLPEIILFYSNRSYPIYPNGTHFIIGRDRHQVSLQILNTKISRKHCSIYYQNEKFLFQDHSTNGSFLKQKNNAETFVKREAVPLLASGEFSLGQTINNAISVFRFQLR